jgi:uncharacterized protein (TIGR04255 family)
MTQMNPKGRLVINLAEEFRHLPRAPIVEAVIDIRSHAAGTFEEAAVRQFLEPRLDGYEYLDTQRAVQHELTFEVTKPPRQMFKDLGLKGLRFRSADQKSIAQFNRDGFIHSRLEPYSDWTSFSGEGLRLWEIFKELAQPVEINRIGLRFISRIELPLSVARLDDYIKPAPETPRDLELPFVGFMHHDTLAVPGYPYAINLIRTIQPPQAETRANSGLILDIDVFTTQGLEIEGTGLARILEEMRWLKNKAFFGSVTEKALEAFQ